MYKVPGAGGAMGAGAGTLAFTGANVTWWFVFGVLLVIAGVLSVLVGRRRRRLAAIGKNTIAS
ncbi:MAG TPA: LPXTG cell wall anchor domain-containing protein [Pseudonocardiaceae bacterium]|jgi:LPXTG-motif cell wall-anchored protein